MLIAGPAGDRPPVRQLRVERSGPLATVQDLGRPGLAALGVSRAGAADRSALRRANRLVGNPEDAACLELLLGGAVLLAGPARLLVAVTGAACPLLLDGRPVGRDALLDLPPGGRLEIGTPPAGLRGYVAVRGGLTVPPVLGSRSRDTLAGLGPPPCVAGDVLPVGHSWVGEGPKDAQPLGWPSIDQIPTALPPGPDRPVDLRAVPGPRADWLDPRSLAALWSSPWEVTTECDRVGIRLRGPALERPPALRGAELASEGLVAGAVQVPPGGRPVLFLADHPVTGGYPVAAVLLASDVDRAAQARPGQRLRFHRVRAPRRRAAGAPIRPDCDNSWWGW
jgi:biotin-dependent carboxylase-like uncharacterized protein